MPVFPAVRAQSAILIWNVALVQVGFCTRNMILRTGKLKMQLGQSPVRQTEPVLFEKFLRIVTSYSLVLPLISTFTICHARVADLITETGDSRNPDD